MIAAQPQRAPRLPRLPRDFRPTRLAGQRVLVIGLGTFGGGVGAARHLAREGADVTVSDRRGEDALRASIRALEPWPVRLALGRDPNDAELTAADWIVASPAVKWSAPPLAAAARRGIPVESEITLLTRLLPCEWVGVTGTNGKSTTTMLATRALAAGGRRVLGGGNSGGSLLDDVAGIGRGDAVVLELSSFQLEHLEEIGHGPTVAVVTNVTPDHLDRHGTFEEYARVKRSILARARAAILPRSDPAASRFAEGFPGNVAWFGEESSFDRDAPGARLLADATALRRTAAGAEERVDLSGMTLRGVHNRLNLLAAALAAAELGTDFRAAAAAAADAPPLLRRLNEVARVRGVLYVDDSVSTSPPAVSAALRSFPGPTRLLAGGYDKGIDPEPLVESIRKRCTKAYLFGAAARDLAARLERTGFARAGFDVFADLPSAFRAATSEAAQGDTVLLSPGYASYDQFRDFTERGDLFRALVAALGAP